MKPAITRPDHQPVRDFVYLDWERVRSYVAQVERGVPEERSGTLQQDEHDSFQGSVGIPGFASAATGDDVRYSRSATETRSLHHSIYNSFEALLDESGALTTFDSSYDNGEWTPANFSSRRFCRATGVVRIVDYNAIFTMIEKLPELLKLGHLGERQSLQAMALDPADRTRRRQELEKAQREQLKEWNSLNPQSLGDGIRSLFGDALRIKIVPDPQRPRNLFVATADPDNFERSIFRAIGARGLATNADWTALLQTDVDADSLEDLEFTTGNTIEDSVDKMVTAMEELSQVTSRYEFPAVEATPVAIYRTFPVSAGDEG